MPKIEYADPLRNIGIALDRSFSHNREFEEHMGCAIRHYQHPGIDADSDPLVIKMEKDLGEPWKGDRRSVLVSFVTAESSLLNTFTQEQDWRELLAARYKECRNTYCAPK